MPADPYSAAWTRLRTVRRWRLVCLAVGFVLVVFATHARRRRLDLGSGGVYLVLLSVVALGFAVVIWLKLRAFECPRCNQPFFERAPLASRRQWLRDFCFHCGLPVGAPGPDE